MSIKHAAVLAVSACLFFVTADAASWGQPGLWQTSTTMQMSMAGMPTITPEQMAQMKKMGIKIPMMGGQAFESKTCLTPADTMNFSAERYSQQSSGCKQDAVTRSGNHIVTTVVCNGDMKGNGRADVTLIDGSHYASVFAFKGISHGHPVDMKISTTAHWLGANCGSVKPFHHG